jgi:hypothetical protein
MRQLETVRNVACSGFIHTPLLTPHGLPPADRGLLDKRARDV